MYIASSRTLETTKERQGGRGRGREREREKREPLGKYYCDVISKYKLSRINKSILLTLNFLVSYLHCGYGRLL